VHTHTHTLSLSLLSLSLSLTHTHTHIRNFTCAHLSQCPSIHSLSHTHTCVYMHMDCWYTVGLCLSAVCHTVWPLNSEKCAPDFPRRDLVSVRPWGCPRRCRTQRHAYQPPGSIFVSEVRHRLTTCAQVRRTLALPVRARLHAHLISLAIPPSPAHHSSAVPPSTASRSSREPLVPRKHRAGAHPAL